jgi:hypothetical protein
MSGHAQQLNRLDGYKIAVLLGLASIPFTAALYWQSPGTVSGGPVLMAGLLAGLLSADRPVSSTRAGAVAGVVGSAVSLWPFAQMVGVISTFSQPAWFSLLQVAVAANLVILGAGLFALGGACSGWVGAQAAGRLRRNPPSAAAP